MRSTNSSPRRRALHERTPSHTNEYSPPSSVRAVSDKHMGQDEHNVYSATPFPTKPEQILLPRPGKGQHFVPDSRFHVDDGPSVSTGTVSTDTSQIADSSLIDQSVIDPWDLSSTFDAVNTPSQVWEDDPNSSKSSFPEPDLPEHKPARSGSNDGSIAVYSDDELRNVPKSAPTIKPVVHEPSSRQPSSSDNVSSVHSSPNVVPIGPPSSPNFVALDNSSLNFVPIGTSSNPDTASRSNSLSSLNSLGTVIRYAGAAQWTHGPSSELGSSRSQSFRSSPPYQVPSVRSNSTRPSVRSARSHSRSATSSSRSGPPSDIQAIVDSGVFIQYPTVRGPSSSSSRVDQVSHSAGSSDDNLHRPVVDYSSDRFKSHLSTVTSRWSAEGDSFASPADDHSDSLSAEPSPPPTALMRQRPASSSVWLVNDPDEDDEYLDNLSSLPPRPTNPGVPNSQSSSSRSSSVRSNKRPGTSSSFVMNLVPAWARMYYSAEGEAGNSTLSLVEGSRPPTARPATSNSNPLHRLSTVVSRARTLTNETRESVRWQPAPDPRDPRAHWVAPPEPPKPTRGSSFYRLRHSWSPHLFPDRRVIAPRSSVWGAPSLDSRTEPLLGRRNIQVWSFCVGFVCPLTWFIASFLPLPKKPEMVMEENRGPQLETTLQMRLFDLERRRHQNARWWRNLNRWMTPLGLVIITIIITLAVVGTTVGL